MHGSLHARSHASANTFAHQHIRTRAHVGLRRRACWPSVCMKSSQVSAGYGAAGSLLAALQLLHLGWGERDALLPPAQLMGAHETPSDHPPPRGSGGCGVHTKPTCVCHVTPVRHAARARPPAPRGLQSTRATARSTRTAPIGMCTGLHERARSRCGHTHSAHRHVHGFARACTEQMWAHARQAHTGGARGHAANPIPAAP